MKKTLLSIIIFVLCVTTLHAQILYNLSTWGGKYGYGTIGKFLPATNELTVVRSFGENILEGIYLAGTLAKADNGKLYGMTKAGGTGGFGGIFSFDPSTSTYTKLKDFDFINGANPLGSLVQAKDGKLYGMTTEGGVNGVGVIYSFDPFSSTYTKLKDFNDLDGYRPYGSLIQASDGKLYGMTTQGGINGVGVIYSFDPSTSVYSVVKSFDLADGGVPYGNLVQASDGKLYGMTRDGGISFAGVIFSFDIATSKGTKLASFDVSNGASPEGTMIQASDGKLYGMTNHGGNNGDGVIFSFDIISSTITKLWSFDGINGGSPLANLMQVSDGKLYGMARFGQYGEGVIFSFDLTTSRYAKLIDYTGTNGGDAGLGSGFIEVNECIPTDSTWYRDADGDGYGNPTYQVKACPRPAGYVGDSTDCDDNNKAVHAPGTYYRDVDLDGFGDPGHPISACSDTPPAGYVTDNTDCNDSNKAINATVTYYRDFDIDGFGDPGHPISACSATPPAGYVTNNTDCNDNNKAIHDDYRDFDSDGFGDPHHTICACSNTVPAGYVTNNKDCDDDDNTIHTLVTYYRDLDQDGFGDPNQPISASACTPPEGYVADSTDCNDNNKDIHSTVTYYLDFDRDGFGDPGHHISVFACTPPSGYVTNNTDCNDKDNTIHARVTYYRDLDRDGYGDSYNSISVCSNVPPPGYVTTNYDCYDSGTVSHPEYVRVRMCHDGWTQCVNVKDIPEKLSLGWTLGLCPLQSCAADETLMCHNGKQECVKTTDVPQLLAEPGGKWSLGPLCSGTPISGNGTNKTGNAARPGNGKSMPAAFKISNYPNPFEGTTTISYELPVDCKVSIKVYDVVGRALISLVDENKKAGIYRVNVHAERLSSGTLFYRIIAKSTDHQFQQTNQMIKIK